ncbi:MAG: hypothetical protein EOP58_04760 [Sphingomonadales bacterium]|nr:MAG: hypothetical protein EOP58_04760 [Sphingomonadales bacterium]
MANDYPVAVDAPASIAVQTNTPRSITEFAIQDADAQSTPEQIYTVSLNPTHGSLSLGSTQGLTVYDQPILGTGTIGPNGEATFEFTADEGSLLFTGTIADINAALQTLTFTPDSGYTGPAAVEMTAMDAPPGGGPNATSERQTITVNIGALAAIAGLDGDGAYYTEGAAPLAIDVDGDATVSGSDFEGTTLRFEITVNGVASEDLLDIDQTNGVALDQGYVDGGTVRVDGVAIGVMVIEGAAPGSANTPGEVVSIRFNADATAADVERMIHSITYVNLNLYEPSAATRTVTTTLTTADLIAETFSSTIDVVPDDDDAPIAVDLDTNTAGLNAEAIATEDGGVIMLALDAVVTDDAARDIAGGSLTVSIDGPSSFDQLIVNERGEGPGLVHVVGNTLSEDGVVFATFSGGNDGTPLVIDFAADGGGAVASAPLEALYRAIGYFNTSEDPQGIRTVSFALDDGYLFGNPAPVTATVTLVGLNDVPVIDLNGDAEPGTDLAVDYYENAVATPLAPDLALSDVDNNVLQGARVAITENWDATNDLLLVDGSSSGTVGAMSMVYMVSPRRR